MAAIRCSICNINYPTFPARVKCPVCDTQTWLVQNDEPNANWMELMNSRTRELKELEIQAARMEKPHPDHVVARVYEEAGRSWVIHKDLVDNGYRNLESFSIVLLNGVFYELQGFLDLGDGDGAWWIEEVKTEWDDNWIDSFA